MGSSVNRTWIVSDSLTGHRAKWVSALSSQAFSSGEKPGILTIQSSTLDDCSNHEAMLPKVDSQIVLHSNSKSLRNFILNNAHNSKFIFPEIDKHLFWLFIHRIDFRGIVMRPFLSSYSLFSYCKWVIKWFLIFCLNVKSPNSVKCLAVLGQNSKYFPSIWVSDDITLNYAKHLLADLKNSISNIHPLVETSIIVPGFLDMRKNPKFAIEVFQDLTQKKSLNLNLLFVGKTTPSFRRFFSQIEFKNVYLIDKFATDIEYLNFIKAAKIILLPYETRGASGIVIEAVLCGTSTVIVGNRKWKNLEKSTGGFFKVVSYSKTQLISAVLDMLEKPKGVAETSFKFEEQAGVSHFLLDG